MSTKISDIIVPAVFGPYVIQRTAALSALWRSGIVATDAEIQRLANSGSRLLNLPFFNDLTGSSQVLTDQAALTVGKIGANKDVAALHLRGNAWGVNDLSKVLSGDDPAGAIAQLVAEWWARDMQTVLIAMLNGMIADNVANDSGDMVKNVALETTVGQAAANWIGSDQVVDAIGTMGDAYGKLVAIAMHSVQFQRLQKANLITFEHLSEQSVIVPRFLGLEVIVDDACPKVAGSTSGYKYTSYLFGKGAVAWADSEIPHPAEDARDSLAGEDILISRRHFILHPRGVKFTDSSCAGQSPTNAELATAANWDRVYERKNVRIAALITNG
jgi:hypothetical protein